MLEAPGVKKVRFMAALSALVLAASISAPVFAEEKAVTAKIPVTMEAEGTNEAFTVRIDNEPSKFVSVDRHDMKLKSGESGNFIVTAIYPGNYDFDIWQDAGTDKSTAYDDTQYRAKVCVTEDDNGVMSAQTFVFRKGVDSKSDSVSFRNVRHNDKTKNPQTGDQFPIGAAATAGLSAVALITAGIRVRKEKKHAK